MYRYALHVIQANGRALIDAMQLPALVGITRHGHLQETRAQAMPDGPLVQISEKYFAKPLAVPGFKRAQRGVLQEPHSSFEHVPVNRRGAIEASRSTALVFTSARRALDGPLLLDLPV